MKFQEMTDGIDKYAQRMIEGHRLNPRLYTWIRKGTEEIFGPFMGTEAAMKKRPAGPGWRLEGKDQM